MPTTPMMYRQCLMARPTPTGTTYQTSWIPACFARPGQVLRLRNSAGDWEEGWRVQQAGRHELTEEKANVGSRRHLKSRKATDI